MLREVSGTVKECDRQVCSGAQGFTHALDRLFQRLAAAGEGEANVARRAEPGTGNDRHAHLVDQILGEGLIVLEFEIRDGLPHIGESVEGTARRPAGYARQRVERRDDVVMALLEGAIHVRYATLVAIQRRNRRLLRDDGGIGRGLSLDHGQGGGQFARAAAIPETPAGHGVGLRAAFDRDGAIVEPGHDAQQTCKGLAPPVDFFVHVVSPNDDARMQQQHLTQRAPFGSRVGRARRMAGAVDQQHRGPRRDRRRELRRGHLVSLLGARVGHHRPAVGEQGHVRVRYPVGRRDDHLVARIQNRHAEIENALLGARGHEDLIALVGNTVVALEFGDDGVLEFRNPIDIRVARESAVDRLHTGRSNVRWRVEIRLPGAQADDIPALGLQARDQRRHGQSRGRLDALRASGNSYGHEIPLNREEGGEPRYISRATMETRPFELVSEYQPAGDQPQAIPRLTEGLEAGLSHQTLLGVTGSGKTYTVAHVIDHVQRPTLVLAHNKTLAAQLYGEFRELFPRTAVEYFVSYYDYYQPEA